LADFDLSNFLASFFDEARERLNSINQGLVDFESGTLNDEGLISLRRDAHTIKGSALMLGVADIGGAAHLFEDVMEKLIEHPTWRTAAMTQFLYDVHDSLDGRLEAVDAEAINLNPLRAKYDALIKAGEQGDFDLPDTLPTIDEGSDEKAHLPQSDSETLDLQTDLGIASDATADTVSADNTELDINFEMDETSHSDEALKIESSAESDVENTAQIATKHTGLIGADEAADWRKERDKARSDALLQEAADETIAQLAEIDQAADEHIVEPLTSSPYGDLNDFRPDMSQIEMATTAQRKSSGRFLRVDAERLEGLSNQVIELSTEYSRSVGFESAFDAISSELRTLRREWLYFSKAYEDMNEQKRASAIMSIERHFDDQVRRHRRFVEDLSFSQMRSDLMVKDLRAQVLSLMLRPLDSIFSTFPRSVRDVAVKLNKRVRLTIGGKSLEMDQGVAESLVEPLIHLLNNAVAHGIETPQERLEKGKPEEGQVSIIARQSGSEIRIEVIDDGKGLDVERIKSVAVERGVTTQVEADQMDSAELLEMIFRPGFSTKEIVDDTSGRGIGMNVVQDTVRRLTGSIRIHSEKDQGTRFILSLPVSIAVQHALIFRMGHVRFGILTHMVEQALPLHTQTIEVGATGKDFIRYGKFHVPIVDMRKMLSGNGDGLSSKPSIIIAEHIEGYVGIVVDELMDDIEIMVRDLDPYLKRYHPQGLMGNTIASDGSVIMLLEPYGIKEMGRTSPDQHIEINIAEDEKISLTILLVDDSLIAREVEKSIFESIGFKVDTAIDGLDGLEKLEAKDYDMVVTDLEMPRLDGFGFVRRIRNQNKYDDLPVMIISTRESAQDRMRALESGADTYMVKQHLNGDEILKTVQSLIGSIPPSQ